MIYINHAYDKNGKIFAFMIVVSRHSLSYKSIGEKGGNEKKNTT